MATRQRLDSGDSIENIPEQSTQDDSSESEGETEPAKAFHRRISTNREIKTTRCIKEGYLMKQTSSFQRWRKRYFKLKGRKLYYAKDTKSLIFDEIELTDLSVAECSTKNVNHSFQVITPFRNLVLCADSRKDMEEWVLALKKAANREFYDPNADHRETLSGQHNWYSCSHARPTYCNVCREALSGVTSHGLSCEVCKFKVHKRCAVRARNNCKWTTLASVGKDIMEEEDGTISTPHQWIEGNLPVSAKCVVCDKTCGSVLRLQDWRCLWCRAMVHTGCREAFSKHCPLGQCRVSILPPIAIDNLDLDGYCEATKPAGTSPLLVFVNSKSGDNQGVKFLRRFKQLLNPAQVFDLINGGPHIGLRLFQKFDTFRILVCGGDGSIGWVLSEIDKLGLHKQCQVGVLPLGTGNDLSRVLGWGSSFDDDTQLPSVLERMEHAQIKMLDRWSIHIFEGSMPAPRKLSQQFDPISAYEDSVAAHLSKILQSDDHSVVISSAKVLCETVKDFVAKVGSAHHIEDSGDGEDSIGSKCTRLNQKLDALLGALSDESQAAKPKREPALGSEAVPEVLEDLPSPSSQRKECQFKPTKQTEFKPREQLMSRANSLKKAIRQIIEHTERAVDEQNFQSLEPIGEPITENPPEPLPPQPPAPPPPTTQRPPSLQIPTITTETIDIPEVEDQDEEVAAALHSPVGITMGTSSNFLSVPVFTFTSPERDFGKASPYGLMPIPSPPPTAARLGPEGRSRSPSPAPIRLPSPLPSPTSGDFSLPSSPGPLTPPFLVSGAPEALPSPTLLVPISSPSSPRPTTRRISSMSTFSKSVTFAPTAPGTLVEKEEKKVKETKKEIHPLTSPTIMGLSSGLAGSLAGGSFISRVLLANADALCAAATPLIEEDISLEEYKERCVMNNYFGIGLDAKITLDFHIKREEHPEKCRSRTKNMMWYGVLGGKEILNRTFKNLDQRVQLECDGHRIPLPSLQGIVVLNIPSYMGGANFWGGTKQDDYFRSPSFDDKVLEVVAVFSGIQLGISNIFNLQRHRIAQCRSVKITIMGDEPVPVQVDGEAWMQLPGFIRIVHKNRAQMLTRDKVFEEALRTWTEKQRLERPVSPRHNVLSDDEISILHAFVDATEQLIKSVKVASISNSTVEQELFHLATQASSFLDRLYPAGKLLQPEAMTGEDFQPAIRTQVSDLVSSVRSLYKESQVFLADKASALHLRPDIEEGLITALANLDHEMKKVYEIGGLPHFHTIEEEIATSSESYSKRGKEKEKSGHKFRLMSKLMKSGKKEKERSPGPSAFNVHEWGTEEVAQWLDSLGLGEYREGFIRNDIRGPELLHLERRDLKDLGITKVGHLKRVQQGIKEVQSKMSALDKSATVL